MWDEKQNERVIENEQGWNLICIFCSFSCPEGCKLRFAVYIFIQSVYTHIWMMVNFTLIGGYAM